MAIPLPAVTWRLRQTRLPRLRGRCAACAAASTFDPTGRFRVNANGKTIDVWLLLRCQGCGQARKVTVVERSPLRSIDPALLRRYHDNDPGLVADGLGISRAAAERLRADGRIRSSTRLDTRTSSGFSFTLDDPGPG